MKSQFRKPDRYAEPIPPRRRKKWNKIINAFMEGRFDELKIIHRTGARGRIFEVLVKGMLGTLKISNKPEPIFDRITSDNNLITMSKWYLDFASKYDLKKGYDQTKEKTDSGPKGSKEKETKRVYDHFYQWKAEASQKAANH